MATSKVRNYNIQPYYDDFDETKNYHRVLFRPGYAVQARELTQLQTALQAQIDRYGQYAFKDGSRVLGGKVSINVEYDFIKLKSSFSHSVGGSLNSDDYLSDFVGSTITGYGNTGNQVTAKVVGFCAASGSDLNTLYIKYEAKGGTNRDVGTFVADEEIISNATTVSGTVRYGELVASGSTPTGQGSIVNIEQGVYFIAGTFVYVEAESLLLDKYTNTPSYIVGLTVTENLVSSDDSGHGALVDNATGTSNFAAPGANRYQISTALVKEPLAIASRSTDSYIPLVTVELGKVQFDKTDKNNDVELGRRLARRTFEESGNYAVQPFELNIREYLNTGTNFGFKTNTQIVADGDAGSNSAGTTYGTSRLAVGVEPSVAYVKGFRNENLATKYVKVDKPRGADATATANAATTDVVLGNYIRLKLDTVAGLPDITNFTTLALKNQSGSNIGTARARGMEIVGSGSTGYASLYLFDIAMTGGNTFNSTRSVSQADSPLAFTADLINKAGSVGPAPQPLANTDAFLFDAGNSSLIYKLPYDAVKTLTTNGQDNLFRVKQGFKVTSAGSGGTVTFSVSGTNTFVDRTNNIIAVNGGSFMKLDGTGAYTYSTNNSTTLVVSGVPNNTSVELIATVQKTNEAAKTKTRVNNATVANTVGAGKIGLTKADIIRIVSITDGNSVDVTERFSLDNGQRDNFYDRGSAVLKPGFPTPTGTCTVTYDYYTHGSGTYLTVDSYPTADYDTIGEFTGVKGTLKLRECVDFRPRIDDDGSDYTTAGASLSNPPHPGHSMNNDVTYYMPRIDKLYVNRSGEFLIEKGVPADSPSSPATPDDAMGLYDLHLEPYVYSLSDIKPELLDNKRYTMRDIGKLDKRIKTLEYYTSLSLLEQSASDAHIVDSAGLSRFKNGFLVDAFTGHSVGDTANNDYMISIDKSNGHLRPKFDERNVNLIRKASDSGSVVVSSSLAHLPIASNTTIINQPYASSFINVNPYNVFSWDGVVKLSPDSDEWKEVDQRPSILIDDTSQYDQFVNMAEESGILGTVWNEWETNWTGTTSDQDVFEESGRGRRRRITTTTVTSTANQARAGLRRDLSFDTVQRESDDRVVEINFIPFMRSREVFFSAQLMKPLTKVFAYFDGSDITAFCKQKAFVEFATRSNIVDHQGVTSHPDSTSGTLTTDANGNLTGSFVIPNNSALRFKTGSREFRLTDSATNTISVETTSAEAQYQARGLLESKQSTITSTKVPQLSTQELSDGRTIVETEVSEKVEWIDPIAESILITEEGGTFATSVDIFFQSANAENIPVRLTIREMENGSPTQRIVPGADKVLPAATVRGTISATAATAANFAFDHPVYLEQDHEYAIVLTSQCDDYNVWIAEMGKFDVTNTSFRITKQPYNGVFFTSANASTWTPEQAKDLKFKLNSAVFNTSGAITLVNDVLPVRKLPGNPFTTASGDATVTVNHPNHGLANNSSKVTFAGAVAVNNISAANLNGQRTVTIVDHDSYTFEAGGNANAAGSGGGTAVTSTENRHMDVMNNIIQNLTLPNTQLRFFATTYSGKSISGAETPYQAQTEFEILPGRNVIFATPKVIGNQDNETSNMGGNKSYSLRCTMSTTKTNLSPIIDMNRASVVTVQNRINNGSTAETAASGGTNIARYITKAVSLADDADTITVFLDANRPASANIDLYYRVITSGADTPITEVAFTKANPTTTIPINDNPLIFKEAQFDIDPLGANVSFGTMQFKIVLRSTNTSTVPKVKDFRAIAAT